MVSENGYLTWLQLPSRLLPDGSQEQSKPVGFSPRGRWGQKFSLIPEAKERGPEDTFVNACSAGLGLKVHPHQQVVEARVSLEGKES